MSSALILNADDWGRDEDTTNRTLECHRAGALSSVSAMVFTADAERAAALALETGIDTGLHINLTMPFSASCASTLQEHQERVSRYLRSRRMAQAIYHPGLAGSFRYAVLAQRDEFERLYGFAPQRLDGHHHMHLASNVVLGGLLPKGTIVRRNFSFQPGEKSMWNRRFRGLQDRLLARHHRMTDYFYSLPPLEPAERVAKIFALAEHSTVEVETHPIREDEYRFLTGGGLNRPVARSYQLS